MAGESGQSTILNICILAKTDIWNQPEIKPCLCLCFAFIIKAILLNSAGTHQWPISRRWSDERHFEGDVIADKPVSLFHLELASCWWLTALSLIIHLGLGVWRSGDHLFGHWEEVAPSSNIHRPSVLPIHSQNTQSPTKHTQILIFSTIPSAPLSCTFGIFRVCSRVCVLPLRSCISTNADPVVRPKSYAFSGCNPCSYQKLFRGARTSICGSFSTSEARQLWRRQ